MIKLVCDICKKEVDRRDVCDEDGHATKDAMIDIEVLTTYCREYGEHYLICVDCYNSIRDFINSRHAKWGFPKTETKNPGEWINPQDCVCYQCSNCKEYTNNERTIKDGLFDYCPKCGAKMRNGGTETKNPREGTDFNDYLTEQLKDPEFKKEWENVLKGEENGKK